MVMKQKSNILVLTENNYFLCNLVLIKKSKNIFDKQIGTMIASPIKCI